MNFPHLPISVALFAVAGLACAEDAGLVARWTFEGAPVTEVTRLFPAELVGPIAWAANPAALSLDGKKSFVRLARAIDPGALPAAALTVEAWVLPRAGGAWGGVAGCLQDNGAFERGWILGFHSSRFCFGLTAKDKLTYLDAPQEMALDRWHHVAGSYDGATMRLFVDGREVATSTAQKGPINYARAPFVLGAYHDDDEFYPFNGLLREVALHDRALAPRDIAAHFAKQRALFPLVGAPPPVNPRVRFVSADAAVVEWETAQPEPSGVAFGMSAKLSSRANDSKPVQAHALRLAGLQPDTKYFFTIERPEGLSERFDFETNFNFTVPPISADAPDDETFARLAAEILKTTGVTKGYCLDYGCGEGRLALELARRSELTVVGVSDDAEAIARGRKRLDAAGVYGPRLALVHTPLDRLPFTKDCFNLVVSSDALTGVKPVPDSPELARVVRPAGGVTMLTRDAKSVRPPLPGAGSWTHAYGDAAQTANSGDRNVIGREMRVQWFGEPGARGMLDRQSRNPPPLIANGTLFVQGNNRLYAQDAYNGRMLWNLEVPGLRRVNLPRDSSNMCADDDALFVAVRDRCWSFGARTGALTRTFLAPGEREWGYLASDGPRLIGTTIQPGSTYTQFQGSWEFWYDALTPESTAQICSDRLFALNKDDGKPLWNYANGAIFNSTIAIADGRICFLEARSPGLTGEGTSRLASPALFTNAFLVALEAASGRVLWEKPVAFSEKNVIAVYLCASAGRLVLSISGDKHYRVSAFAADDGKPQWEQRHAWNRDHHGGHLYHPVVVGGNVIVEPVGYELATGKTAWTGLPVRGGCSTMSAAANCVHYINWDYDKGSIYFWDLDTGERREMAGSRASCWLSLVSGGGLAILPASSAGCTCRYPNQNSLGFAPR